MSNSEHARFEIDTDWANVKGEVPGLKIRKEKSQNLPWKERLLQVAIFFNL